MLQRPFPGLPGFYQFFLETYYIAFRSDDLPKVQLTVSERTKDVISHSVRCSKRVFVWVPFICSVLLRYCSIVLHEFEVYWQSDLLFSFLLVRSLVLNECECNVYCCCFESDSLCLQP